MAKVEVRIDAMLSLECEGYYIPGIEPRYSHGFGNWLPGEPEEIRRFKVFLCDVKKPQNRIDITECLTKDVYEEIYSQLLKTGREEE